MKKQYLTTAIIAMLMAFTTAFAQPVFKASSYTVSPGGQVVVPIKVAAFTSILSMQGTIDFDQTVLAYVQVEQMGLAGMTSGNFGTTQVGSGRLTYSWNDAQLIGVDLADSSTVFAVRFNVIGSLWQQSSISFGSVPTALEVIDGSFNTLNPAYISGLVTISGGININPTFRIDTVTTASGSVAGLTVRVWNFMNIASIQGTIGFNQNVVTYSSVSQFGLSGLSVGNFGTAQVSSGKLTYSWNDATLDGVDVPDSSVIFAVSFNAIGTAGQQSGVDFLNAPTALEVADSNFNTLTPTYTNGLVLVSAITAAVPESDASALQVYPNPFSNQIKIAGAKGIKLYNAFGQLVYSKEAGTLNETGTILTGNFAKGVYFLQITNGSETVSRKMVKQ